MTAHSPEAQEPAGPRSLRVLAVIKGLGLGGAERLVVNQARDAVEGVTFEVINTDGLVRDLVDELTAAGVPVSHLGGRRWWLLELRTRLRSQPTVDVLHVHSPRVAVLVRLLRYTLRPRRRPLLITTEHSLPCSRHPVTRWAHRVTLRFDDHRFAVSEQARQALPAEEARRTEVIPPNTDLTRARGASNTAKDVRSSLDLTPSTLVVGIVGRLRTQKDHAIFLAAAHRVHEERSDVRFLVVGDGPERAAIEELRRELDLEQAVRLLGGRQDGLEVIAACDVLCLSSRVEGLGLVVLEAMAVGVPVVSTAAGGVVELIDHGVEGLLVPIGDSPALADALLQMISDDQLRTRMGAAGQRRAAGFDNRQVHALLARRYRELAGHRP